MKIKNLTNKGQSLFEVVVALAISALIISAIVSLVTNSIRNSTYSKNESSATKYAQELVEWLRGKRDIDISTILEKAEDLEFTIDTSTGLVTWCFNQDLNSLSIWSDNPGVCGDDEKILGTPFSRQAAFRIVNPTPSSGTLTRILTAVEIDVSVSWEDSQGDHKVVNSTTISDLRQR